MVDRIGAASAGWLALVESGVGASAVLSVWLFAIVQSVVTEAAWFAGEAHDTNPVGIPASDFSPSNPYRRTSLL